MNATKREVIATHSNRSGGFYLAREGDKWIAGLRGAEPQVYESAQQLYDLMYPFAVDGDHAAWNVCVRVKRYLHGEPDDSQYE